MDKFGVGDKASPVTKPSLDLKNEEIVAGVTLLVPLDQARRIVETAGPECFFDPLSRAVMEKAKELVRENETPSLFAVAKSFMEDGKGDLAVKVAGLTGSVPSHIDALQRARKIAEYKAKTDLVVIGSRIHQAALNNAHISLLEGYINDAQEKVSVTRTSKLPSVLFKGSSHLLDIEQSLTEMPPNQEWLIKGYIPVGIVGILSATGGVGKSFLAKLIAIAVAGRSVTPFEVDEPKGVFILNVEDSKEELWRRLYSVGQVFKFNWEEVKRLKQNLEIYPGMGRIGPLLKMEGGNPVHTEYATWLLASLHNLNPSLVILDTKSRLFGVDENSNEYAALWLRIFEGYIVDHPHCSFLILHHHNKFGANSVDQGSSRGASALIDNSRLHLTLKSMTADEAEGYGVDRKEYFSLHNAKNSYGREHGATWFKRAEGGVPVLVDLKGDLISNALNRLIEILVDEHGGEFNQRELLERTTGAPIRKTLKDEFGLSRPRCEELVRYGIDTARLTIYEDEGSTAPKKPVIIKVRIKSEKAKTKQLPIVHCQDCPPLSKNWPGNGK